MREGFFYGCRRPNLKSQTGPSALQLLTDHDDPHSDQLRDDPMSPAIVSARKVFTTRRQTSPRSDSPPPNQAALLRVAQLSAEEALTTQLREALAQRSYHGLRTVDINVHEGLVRLTGRVSSYYQKQLATAAVLSLDGVEELTNDLQIVRPAIR